jgi:hypothetical protein
MHDLTSGPTVSVCATLYFFKIACLLTAYHSGVFAEGNASLDYRILEHEDMAALVLGQLYTLDRNLRRLATYHAAKGDQVQIRHAENLYEEDDGIYECESDPGVVYDTSGAESEENSQSGEEPPLVSIVNAVHRLHRVSMAIRQSGSRAHNEQAAAEQFVDRDGVDLVKKFADYTLELLGHHFKPDQKGETFKILIERLASTNGERRRRFLYHRRHQYKLKAKRPTLERGMTDTGKEESVKSVDTSLNVRKEEDGKAIGNQTTINKTTPTASNIMSTTTASRVQRSHFKWTASMFSEQSTVTTRSTAASTQIEVQSRFIPPAPKVESGAREFQCPYCYKVQPVSETRSRKWKQHFMKDLEPFVCLVPNCTELHSANFHDPTSWLRHMESHGKVFTCRMHREGPQKFHLEAHFDEHMKKFHPNMSKPQLAQLKKPSMRSGISRIPWTNCMFCDFKPKLMPPPGVSIANHDGAYQELMRHVTSHMHNIAMWSLLEADDIDDSLPSEPSLQVADETTQNADNMSVEFDREWKQDLDEFDNDPDCVQDEKYTNDGTDPLAEWDFIVEERRKSSHDVDTEPKLENFRKRLILNKVLADGGTVDPQIPCYILPFKPNKHFHGRTQAMDKLEMALHPSRVKNRLGTMTLTGVTGIGKTQIAQEFCHRFQQNYDIILWIHADQENKLQSDFMKIALALGFVGQDTPEAKDHVYCRQKVKAWLINPVKTYKMVEGEERELATWLIVFDHIRDPDLLNEYWPLAKSGSILMTSRKAMLWSETHYPVYPVQPWNAIDSASFLSTRLKTKDIKLPDRAHHSPIQLYFLVSIINKGQYSLQEFIEASHVDSGEQAVVKLHLDDARENKTDFAEWALESLSPQASDLLDVLSMLDTDEIVERILMSPPDDICIEKYPVTTIEYRIAREELMSYSFISKDTVRGTIKIQRLVQDAARRRMSPSAFRDVFNTCVALLNDAWPYQPFTWRHSINRWARCEELYRHVVRLREFAERILTERDDFYGAYQYARLAVDVGWYCHERGRAPECEDFCTVAERVTNRLKGFLLEYPDTHCGITPLELERVSTEIHMNRGCSAAEMNRPLEALKSKKLFNKKVKEELGDSHPGIDMRYAISWNELGVGYFMIDGESNRAM